MIAFKTFAQAPQNEVPSGIPTEWPWQEMSVDSEMKEHWEGHGFTVVSEADYAFYKSIHQEAFDAWNGGNGMSGLLPLTPRQLRLKLLEIGITDQDVQNAINSLEEPVKSIAKIEWEYSIEFDRYSDKVAIIGAMLNLTAEQLDTIWSEAIEY